MSSLSRKHIVLGISGGIAAYKSAEYIRRLRDCGAQVRVVMTPAAQAFITPLTLQALSGNPVHTDLLDEQAEAAMGHIELAKWADAVIIAPASADCIARLAAGMANDLLTTICLATEAPIAIAPAMNQAMWAKTVTQANCQKLASFGHRIWGPAAGAQACGDTGPGRMLEPAELVQAAQALFSSNVLSNCRVVITAGPTREAIDPVRYISNHSSGKMGFALAQAALDAGAETTLIAGPVTLATPPGASRIDVQSAEEMHSAALLAARDCDIFIATAAVADYRPQITVDQKIKKSESELQLLLTRNKDIVADVARLSKKPFTVGFAAETQDVEHYAQDKLRRKNLDMIVANDVAATGIGFNSDENAVTVFWPGGSQKFEQAAKRQIATQIIALLAKHFNSRSVTPG